MKESTFDQFVSPDLEWHKLMNGVPTMTSHIAECDDGQGILNVMFAIDGDMHLFLNAHPRGDSIGCPSFRARTFFGGGRQERVRIALLLLALAIKEDNDKEYEERI